MHNQFEKYGISGDWQEHIDRGSSGGIDYKVPQGTPIYAPVDLYLTATEDNGTGGHTLTCTPSVQIRDMLYFQIMHCSAMQPTGRYGADSLLGYSGGKPGTPGAGSSDGAHVHQHAYNTQLKRVPLEPYCTTLNTESENKMFPVRNTDTGHCYTVGKQYIRHEPWWPQGRPEGFQLTANLLTENDTVIQLTGTQFNAMLDSFSIPRQAAVTTVADKGGHWSAEKQIMEMLASFA